MTQMDKEALVLFRDYTFLQLKAFRTHLVNEYKGKAGGATEPYELMLLDRAIEYHRAYTSLKLNGKQGKLREDGLF